MSVFDAIFERLMQHEGGYVNHPNDPGGETMYGVTKRVAQAHGYYGDMRKLPKAFAKKITEQSYYKAVKGDQLDRLIAWQLTDAAYNHGPKQAVKFLQRAIGFTGKSVDGLIGPATLGAVAKMDKNDVVLLFNAERIEFYTGLRGWISFGKGWARRVAGNLRYAAADN